MMCNYLTLRWMEKMSEEDPEIRVLSDFLENIGYEDSFFFGHSRWRDVLFEVSAPVELFTLLDDTYRKWLYNRIK